MCIHTHTHIHNFPPSLSVSLSLSLSACRVCRPIYLYTCICARLYVCRFLHECLQLRHTFPFGKFLFTKPGCRNACFSVVRRNEGKKGKASEKCSSSRAKLRLKPGHGGASRAGVTGTEMHPSGASCRVWWLTAATAEAVMAGGRGCSYLFCS